jgi:hypothetical protein
LTKSQRRKLEELIEPYYNKLIKWSLTFYWKVISLKFK